MSTHLARIAKIDSIGIIHNADRIQIANVLGNQVIVSKASQPGDIGVFFDTELALNEEFAKQNNLFRDKTKNLDTNVAGYLEENLRVRCQKFLKVKSEGLFMPLSSLGYTGTKIEKLKVGDAFDEIEGVKICTKYISAKTLKAMQNNRQKSIKKIAAPHFYEHIDTENIKYYYDQIKKGSLVTLTAKQHGTSIRLSYTKVVKFLPKWKELINKYIPVFKTYTYEYLVGTRRVILFPSDSQKEGFHGSEQFRYDWLEKLKPYLEKGMTIYGELVGWANESPIMSKHDMSILKDKKYEEKYGKSPFVYKYGCLENTNDFYIYRVTYTNEEGKSIDFTWPKLKNWVESRGFKAVKEICEPFFYDGDVEKLKSLVEELTERPSVLTEDYIDPSHISEGIVIRVDNNKLTPDFYKNKSFAFKVLEGIVKEKEVDTEDAS